MVTFILSRAFPRTIFARCNYSVAVGDGCFDVIFGYPNKQVDWHLSFILLLFSREWKIDRFLFANSGRRSGAYAKQLPATYLHLFYLPDMQRVLSVETSRSCQASSEFVSKRLCFSVTMTAAFLAIIGG